MSVTHTAPANRDSFPKLLLRCAKQTFVMLFCHGVTASSVAYHKLCFINMRGEVSVMLGHTSV